MKKRIVIAGGMLLALVVSIIVAIQPAQAATGIRVSAGKLVEANGSNLVLRGINHAHTWYPTQTSSFAAIKAAGANSIRVVLSGGRWTPNATSDVTNVINLCKTNKLICVLENHDTTGYGEQSGAYTLAQAVDYWISVQSALTGQENYVILNIGNEPFGNNATTPNWTTATADAVRRLRTAGFQHTIMVDAPNWGQDWGFTMRDTAPTVLAADTTGNLIFSIHMYGVFDTAAEVTAYVSSFTSRSLALCICEFGDMHSDGNPDEDAIMSTANSAGIGMMGWSWSGNGGGVEYLDMVTGFNPAQRSSWGTRFIAGANGIGTGTREASIYSGVTPTTAGPTSRPPTSAVPSSRAPSSAVPSSRAPSSAVPSSRPPSSAVPSSRPPTSSVPTSGGSSGCTATYTAGGQWQGGFQAAVTVKNNGSSTLNGWTVRFTFPNGQTITQIWNATLSTSGSSPVLKNVSYNGSIGAGGSTEFGFLGSWTGTNGVPTGVTCTSP